MFLNEEFIKIYEKLSEINEIEDLAEKFDAPGAETVYGEEATTVEGVLRYFVEDIPTLAAIIARGRIKASLQKETDTQTPRGEKQHKKRPFVSFSRQLFSHAYRAPKKWKYGIAVSQEKLEELVQQIQGANVSTDFDHPGSTMHVYGAVKLQDETELLITSFGSFSINLNEKTRQALKQYQDIEVEKTDFYDKIKNFFDNFIAERHEADPETLISYTEDTAEVEKHLIKRRPIDSKVVEGFILRGFCRTQFLSPYFKDLYEAIPGLFDYIKEHTNLNEGEFRVWLDDNQQYLNIGDCIVGLVLPSNYKENNYDNPENTAPDVLYLRKLVKEKDLTIYVYKSKEESNIPDIDLSKKQARTLKRVSIIEYFHKITSSREAVTDFIKNELTQYKVEHDYSSAYNKVMASKTSMTSVYEVSQNAKYNYPAFLAAISEYGLTKKDIKSIYQTGQSLPDAKSVFDIKTADAETTVEFLQQLAQQYPDKILCNAYTTWFVTNTNATKLNTNKLIPEEADWRHFMDTCKQRFNYSMFDLSKLSRGEITSVNREPIKTLFKKAAKTNKKTTLAFIKNFASEFTTYSLAAAYRAYMGKYAVDINALNINNTDYSYRLWLEKVTDPNGPVRLTREEVLNYFKEYAAEAQNNN
jgi:C4-type Zn-finger protein